MYVIRLNHLTNIYFTHNYAMTSHCRFVFVFTALKRAVEINRRSSNKIFFVACWYIGGLCPWLRLFAFRPTLHFTSSQKRFIYWLCRFFFSGIWWSYLHVCVYSGSVSLHNTWFPYPRGQWYHYWRYVSGFRIRVYFLHFVWRLDFSRNVPFWWLASKADILLARHAIFPPQRREKIAWRAKRTTAKEAILMTYYYRDSCCML